MSAAKPHPAIVCAKHSRAPRRWKNCRGPWGSRVSVCSVCSPLPGRDRCINGHVGARERRNCDGRLICRICARAATLRHRQGYRGMVRGDAWARNTASLEAAR